MTTIIALGAAGLALLAFVLKTFIMGICLSTGFQFGPDIAHTLRTHGAQARVHVLAKADNWPGVRNQLALLMLPGVEEYETKYGQLSPVH